ncbi:MAG: glycoside hydrolase family 3 C-terminal domain-containing protein, partial [Bacteroidota bacterium]
MKRSQFSLAFTAFLFTLLPSILLGQDHLELLIQEQIDAMTVQEKIAQIHRNTFWTTSDNDNLDIPGFVMADGPHGVRFVASTSYPTGIAIAASWNRNLAYRIGQAMGREFHAYGKHQQLGPSLDLCRDPRNGRSPESGGEDPFLCAHMNIGLVQGIQESPVIATIKHFNAVNRQVDRHNVNHVLTQRQLMEHYGYNFRRVIQDAGPLSVMNAYNRVNGDKSAENANLLTQILRNRWGFPFYVVSDWGSIFDGQNALLAGCDLEMHVEISVYEQVLQGLYDSNQITDADLDRAVRRVLRVKYLTGMMDNMPLSSPFIGANTPEHQELAREAGQEAIVLLKNEDDILPIQTDLNVALIGPSAQVAQLDGFGSSWVDPPYSISPYEGLLEYMDASQIQFIQGCDINSTDTSGFYAARQAAAAADLVIFVGGLDPTQEGENFWPGPVDRTGGSVELPGVQQDLIAALADENSNLITVIKSGGICAVPNAIDDIKGFLYAFYPGMEGGYAIADVLFGTVNPSGKLPVTMPVNDAQMPEWNDDFSDDYNCGYRYYDELELTPQFAFGFGLSYTTFQYSDFQINDANPEAGAPISLSVEITNTGSVAGAEVVQLYLEN